MASAVLYIFAIKDDAAMPAISPIYETRCRQIWSTFTLNPVHLRRNFQQYTFICEETCTW